MTIQSGNPPASILDRILKGIMALGAAAAVALAALIIVTLATRHTGSTQRTATSPRTGNPTFTPVPATPAHPALSPAALCAQKGQSCGLALLALINHDRAALHRPALVYDAVQSSGSGSCAGSAGHSKAMAQTGHIWHRSTRFPQASYPANICGTVAASSENVAVARGSQWEALQRIEQRMLQGVGTGKNHRRLMSRRFTRIGIGIAKRGDRWFVTEDFMR